MTPDLMWKPDIVVGVDVGMTQTGVSYSAGPEWPHPTALQKWPGTVGSELQNKVLTALSYRPNTDAVVKWGWEVDLTDSSLDNVELFKVYLDPAFREFDENRMTVPEAQGYFSDYMRCLYDLIMKHFLRTTPYFKDMKVEFVFSFPTTWNDHGLFRDILSRILKAGFGDNSHNRRVKLSLNEAEAAAVYACRNTFRKGDVLLVLDAGGGTSDLSILKVISTGENGRELKPLAAVGGVPVGATAIDLSVQKLIEERLKTLSEHGIRLAEDDLRKVSSQMLREGRFYSFKCGFGDEAIDVPALPLVIPGISSGIDIPTQGIRDSKLFLTKEEIKTIFDWQLRKIFELINAQLEGLQNSNPNERISHIILSGGLGSSPYLQKKLHDMYANPESKGFLNTRGMNIIVADNPQLAVVQGLVMDRTQEIARGVSTYKERCARLSYGIVCRERYNPARHQGEDLERDPLNNLWYAENRVSWFIYRGQPISTEFGVEKDFKIRFSSLQRSHSWRTRIVSSNLEPSQLPNSMRHDGARQICTVQAEVARDPAFKSKNRRWWKREPDYLEAQVIVRVVVGPADLKFEILTSRGVCSKSHEDIVVHWDEPKEPSRRPQTTTTTNELERVEWC